MRKKTEEIPVGVVGTGYVSRHFVRNALHRQDIKVTSVLTRRPISTCREYPRTDLLTNSTRELLNRCAVVFECSGDPLHAAQVVDAACAAGCPVVTMNAEFHVTAGSYFADRGVVTEAEGDQPGGLAALHEEAVDMGFQPLVYGNLKGFLNHTPTRSEMRYWAGRKGIALDKVTSFTDGTKLQVEQALVANHFGAAIAKRGMIGLEMSDIEEGGRRLAEKADQIGQPLTDYLLFSEAPHGIFIVAKHREDQADFLSYVKMGEGPYYMLSRNEVLVHLQVPRTIRRVYAGGPALLHNTETPSINVAAIAKRELPAGRKIEKGIGSFDARGECVEIARHPSAVPIGLLQGAVITQPVAPGSMITFDDVELPDSLALQAWQHTRRKALATTEAPEPDVPEAAEALG